MIVGKNNNQEWHALPKRQRLDRNERTKRTRKGARVPVAVFLFLIDGKPP